MILSTQTTPPTSPNSLATTTVIDTPVMIWCKVVLVVLLEPCNDDVCIATRNVLKSSFVSFRFYCDPFIL